jgi:hypothetical protein
MICKKCGFEYADGLKECPNCQAPNEPEEPVVLTEEERDTFGGLTIESNAQSTGEGEDYKVYDKEEEEQRRAEEAEQQDPQFSFSVHTFSGMSFIWQLFIILIIIGLIFFLLPVFAAFIVVAVICYLLYSWLFH